jgi:hypothetical protein
VIVNCMARDRDEVSSKLNKWAVTGLIAVSLCLATLNVIPKRSFPQVVAFTKVGLGTMEVNALPP